MKSEIERQLDAWNAREKTRPGGPVDTRVPGGFTAEELRNNVSVTAAPLPPDYFAVREPTLCARELEPTLHDEWLMHQILDDTGVLTAQRTREVIERRIRKLR